MKTVELRDASRPLADYAKELDAESLVITADKKPVAALVSLNGVDRESLALSLSPDFDRIIRRARSQATNGNVFSLDQIKQELSEATAYIKPMQATRSAAKPRRVPSARKKRSPRRG